MPVEQLEIWPWFARVSGAGKPIVVESTTYLAACIRASELLGVALDKVEVRVVREYELKKLRRAA